MFHLSETLKHANKSIVIRSRSVITCGNQEGRGRKLKLRRGTQKLMGAMHMFNILIIVIVPWTSHDIFKVCVLNVCNLWYVNSTSIKLFTKK